MSLRTILKVALIGAVAVIIFTAVPVLYFFLTYYHVLEDEVVTRKVGDAWLKSRRSALARVPSAILPDTLNYLLNPLHPDAARVTIAKVHNALLDERLLR